MKLFNILRRPNRLNYYAVEEEKQPGILTNVRKQVKILHSVGICYVTSFCLSVNFSSVFLGLPAVFQNEPTSLLIAQSIMWYICFNIVSNFLLILYHAKKSHFGFGKAKELPYNAINQMREPDWSDQEHDASSAAKEAVHSDWSKCIHCEIRVPPRCRHCSVCQICVLKKDHHCFFTGGCVGFYNQKYFIVFCFYGIVGGLWGLYNLGTYLTINYAPMFSLQIFKYVLPYAGLCLLFGYVKFYEFCLVLLFYLHITSTAAAVYYFSWQIFIICRGQTSYELVKRKKIYDNNIARNFRSVFGSNWAINFLFPIPMLLNEGDAMSWVVNSKSM